TLSSVLGFGAATALQAPQGKEAVVAAGAPPKLADMLKGYVGRDCWISLREHQMLEISFDPQVHPGTEWKRKIELVGQDFLKLNGDQQLIRLGCRGGIQRKRRGGWDPGRRGASRSLVGVLLGWGRARPAGFG